MECTLKASPNVKHSPAYGAGPPASAAARQHALGLVLWLGVVVSYHVPTVASVVS